MFRTFTCPSSGEAIYETKYNKIVCIKLVHLPYLVERCSFEHPTDCNWALQSSLGVDDHPETTSKPQYGLSYGKD